jgi:hypothetical protein
VLQVTAETQDETVQAVPIVKLKGIDTMETPSSQNKSEVDGIAIPSHNANVQSFFSTKFPVDQREEHFVWNL